MLYSRFQEIYNSSTKFMKIQSKYLKKTNRSTKVTRVSKGNKPNKSSKPSSTHRTGKQTTYIEKYMRSSPHGGEPQEVRSHDRGLPSKFTRIDKKGNVVAKTRKEVFEDFKGEVRARIDEITWIDKEGKEQGFKTYLREAPSWTEPMNVMSRQNFRPSMIEQQTKTLNGKFSTGIKDTDSQSLISWRDRIIERIDRKFGPSKSSNTIK